MDALADVLKGVRWLETGGFIRTRWYQSGYKTRQIKLLTFTPSGMSAKKVFLVTAFWWHEASQLLFPARWTDQCSTQKSGPGPCFYHLMSLIFPPPCLAAAPAPSLLCSLHQSDWIKLKHAQGSAEFELQNKKQKASYYVAPPTGFSDGWN